MLKGWTALFSCCAVAGLASGCFVAVDNEGEVVRTGEMEVRWTVDNTADPAACDYYAPSSSGMDFELALFDGREVAEAHAEELVRRPPGELAELSVHALETLGLAVHLCQAHAGPFEESLVLPFAHGSRRFCRHPYRHR